jgi:hypothetical protein
MTFVKKDRLLLGLFVSSFATAESERSTAACRQLAAAQTDDAVNAADGDSVASTAKMKWRSFVIVMVGAWLRDSGLCCNYFFSL